MKTSASIKLIMQVPETEEGRRQLAKGVADAHAEYAVHTVYQLACSGRQKLALLQAAANTAQQSDRTETPEHIGDGP